MKENIFVNIWGAQLPAILTTWENIKKLGFKKQDRSFGTLNDGRQALFFNGAKMFPRADGTLPNGGADKWFVTTEILEEIDD